MLWLDLRKNCGTILQKFQISKDEHKMNGTFDPAMTQNADLTWGKRAAPLKLFPVLSDVHRNHGEQTGSQLIVPCRPTTGYPRRQFPVTLRMCSCSPLTPYILSTNQSFRERNLLPKGICQCCKPERRARVRGHHCSDTAETMLLQ